MSRFFAFERKIKKLLRILIGRFAKNELCFYGNYCMIIRMELEN